MGINMANFFKKLLDTFNLSEDDELDDEYDEYLFEQEEKGYKRIERDTQGQVSKTKSERKGVTSTVPITQTRSIQKDDNELTNISSYNDMKRNQTAKTERLGSGKVVPIRTTIKGLEVCVMKPASFEESQDICDVILSGRAAVINLEGFDVDLAQRVMDFVSGCIYAVSGRLHQISNYIFIVSPETIDISGDYLDIIEQDKFGVPTLNKGF